MTAMDINRPELPGEMNDVCARAPSDVGAGRARAFGNIVVTTTTFRGGFATAMNALLREGSARVVGQSQTWVRIAEGWRVIAPHVSLIAS